MMREWLPGMGEISGFGGGYEAVCRTMVLAGIAWIDEHPNCLLKVDGYEGIYGLVIPDSPDAKDLEKAVAAAGPVMLDGAVVQETVGEDCTGAMWHATWDLLRYYRRYGWEAFVEGMSAEGGEDPHE